MPSSTVNGQHDDGVGEVEEEERKGGQVVRRGQVVEQSCVRPGLGKVGADCGVALCGARAVVLCHTLTDWLELKTSMC